MKITRLPRGNAQFPKERDPGDVVMLSNGDVFTWSGGLWAMLGGRFIKEEVKEWVLSYLKNGWPTLSEAKFDLPEMLTLTKNTEEDERWIRLMLNNMLKLAGSLESEKIS